MQEELIDFCDRYNGHLYLYGAGLYGRRIGVWLDEHGYDWKGFVETNRSRASILDRTVYSFSECEGDTTGAFIVCVGDRYRNEILSSLQASGIDRSFVIRPEQVREADEENCYETDYSVSIFVNVLLYHRVIDLETDPQLLAVGVAAFEDQIRYLKEQYRILRFEEDWSGVQEKSVVITFDDGYADNYLYALPILEKYGVPATVFVSTENLDTGREMWWDALEVLFLLNDHLPENVEVLGEVLDLSTEERVLKSYLESHRILKAADPDVRRAELERLERVLQPAGYPRTGYRMMTSQELVTLSNSPLISIGGHTVTHSCLANENFDKQRWEIEESKRKLKEIIGREPEVFSYPFGGGNDYTDDTCMMVRDAGYKKAAVVQEGLAEDHTDSMKIPRNLVRNWTLDEFRRTLNRTWSIYG